ncbi:hypothetical protein RUND412_003275 [Rhizina undulata]
MNRNASLLSVYEYENPYGDLDILYPLNIAASCIDLHDVFQIELMVLTSTIDDIEEEKKRQSEQARKELLLQRVDSMRNSINEAVDKVEKGIKEGSCTTAMYEFVSGFLESLSEKIRNFFDAFKQAIRKTFKRMLEKIKTALRELSMTYDVLANNDFFKKFLESGNASTRLMSYDNPYRKTSC